MGRGGGGEFVAGDEFVGLLMEGWSEFDADFL